MTPASTWSSVDLPTPLGPMTPMRLSGPDGERDVVEDRAAAPVVGEVARHQGGRTGDGGREQWSGIAGNGNLRDQGTRVGHGITGSQRTAPG